MFLFCFFCEILFLFRRLWINDSTLQKDRVKIFARLSAFQSMEGVIIPLTAKFISGQTGASWILVNVAFGILAMKRRNEEASFTNR